MPNVMEAILGQFDQSTLDQMSQQLGESPQATGNALAAAVPILLSALSRNASADQGRESLFNALSNDHDGSILDNIMGFLGHADSGPGAGILGHVFGNSQTGVVNALAKATGMQAGNVGQLLQILAPLVMGFLGRARSQQNMNQFDISSMLGGETQYAQSAAPDFMSTISRFLDQDGDGSVVDDLGGLLGRMLANR